MPRPRISVCASASALGALLLSACVPAPLASYYQPSYADSSAQAFKAYCGGQAGPSTGLRATLAPGVELTVDARQATASTPTLDLSFKLDPGVALRFLDDTVEVGVGDLRTTQTPPLRLFQQISVAAAERVDLAGVAPMAGAQTQPAADKVVPAASVRSGWLSGPAGLRPDRLILRWPDLQWADGRTIEFGAIELVAGTTGSGVTVYRSAQESLRMEAEFAQCVKGTPRAACGNILEAYSNGFTVEAGGATLTGRLRVANSASPRLAADIQLSLPSTQAWRWSTPQAELVDAGSGAATRQSLDLMHVSQTRSGLPLSTTVVAPSVAGAMTSAHLATSLGAAGIARYRVQLPALDVNGRRVQPPPIELDRRVLDGAILPFNC